MFTRLISVPKRILIAMIVVYQHTLSPDHGPLRHLYPHGVCIYDPTCSEYGKQIIEKRGAIVGSLLLIKRVASCNPWGKPSPEKVMKALR